MPDRERPSGPSRPAGAGGGALRRPVRHSGHRHRIPAGEFKAICLRLMERVQATGEEYIITKRGRPVAKLVAFDEAEVASFVGRSRGVITARREDLLAPIGEDWEPDADL